MFNLYFTDSILGVQVIKECIKQEQSATTFVIVFAFINFVYHGAHYILSVVPNRQCLIYRQVNIQPPK